MHLECEPKAHSPSSARKDSGCWVLPRHLIQLPPILKLQVGEPGGEREQGRGALSSLHALNTFSKPGSGLCRSWQYGPRPPGEASPHGVPPSGPTEIHMGERVSSHGARSGSQGNVRLLAKPSQGRQQGPCCSRDVPLNTVCPREQLRWAAGRQEGGTCLCSLSTCSTVMHRSL